MIPNKKSKTKRLKLSPKPKSRRKEPDRASLDGGNGSLESSTFAVARDCSSCNGHFDDIVGYEKHLRECARLSCTRCNKSFKTQTQVSGMETKELQRVSSLKGITTKGIATKGICNKGNRQQRESVTNGIGNTIPKPNMSSLNTYLQINGRKN